MTSLNYMQAASGIQKVAICDISGDYSGQCADLGENGYGGVVPDEYYLLARDDY
ncbi:uncharacterized protein METZ01_LOCUS514590 [marine metagenome]|uniref:Uncharacterized protein n=1 Tax=marine metagenome TaxID=408172 RepID=A0A383EXV9_9ZZZZ